MTDRDKLIYQDALDLWGADAQVEMLGEECLELALAARRLVRKHIFDGFVEEMADVQIMLDQMTVWLRRCYPDFDGTFNTIKERKIERLFDRIAEHKK